ncbi:heterokaryon incompatibility protein-domain-containing protein [Annulohypoxylon maeteangense]|uniref:heterokaryon incompatibility protein-domain-containing protein n=1 Tax=Annulohypoxylon maeteangense TaxID=1927788 RepID=UPI002008A888|nr:heterokaryon incompatibility protein-domain-containing protein [Annulohypoxylon maeteangense]KAI0882012.1 heterokaryon incompatibility protein-domain-containing protein [Annulohypoxylon maeteangense]
MAINKFIDSLNDRLANGIIGQLLRRSINGHVRGFSDNGRINYGVTGEFHDQFCPRCAKLDLGPEKFIIRNHATTMRSRRRHSDFDIMDVTLNSSFTLRTGESPREFAELDELRANSTRCQFCQFISSAIKRYSHQDIPGNTKCYLTWQVDGRGEDAEKRVINRTRRLRLSWGSDAHNGQVYLVLAASNHTSGTDSDPLFPLAKNTHSLGREFHDKTEKQALIKSWLDLCHKEHESTCTETHGTTEEHLKLVKETYFGVIDVVDMQLKALPIENDIPARYVALSYVWGNDRKKPRYMSTQKTAMTHIKHGGISYAWAKLPKTIQDAILLVSRLGERYLWIDSLCIVQDSPISWNNNASAMHLIYGHAYFTICAADGDSESGLCAAAPLLRVMHPIDESRESNNEGPSIIEYAPGTRILITRPLEVVICDSMWSKRAWTFQEQILSRRCLIFAEGRIYFQCRFAGISEEIWTDNKGNGWSLNRTNSPLQSPEELKSRPIWFYMRYVRLYTNRNLTKPSDILSAFEGISWLLKGHMNHEQFLFGLPTSHFDLALLWAPTKSLIRRRKPRAVHSTNNKNCTLDTAGECTCEPEDDFLNGAQFPSWAWCGWMGENGTGGQVTYHENVLDGCLLNIRQWLEHHTWIEWHIRDGKGHLRPLRNKINRTRAREIYDEDRWNGYSGSKDWKPVLEEAMEFSIPRGSEFSANRPENPSRRSIYRSPSPVPANAPSSRRTASPTRSIVASARSNGEIRYRVGNGGYLRRGSTMEPKRKMEYEDTRAIVKHEFPQERKFSAIIPDHPFGIIKEPRPTSDRAEDERKDVRPLQHMPILQFYTFLTELYVTVRFPLNTKDINPQEQLLRCDIADDAGDWCGSIEVPAEWISEREDQRFHFIAISHAKAFTTDECPIWTYYIPKEREESQWDLYYILLLERDNERCLWERVALGKVFRTAFEKASWSEIKLG